MAALFRSVAEGETGHAFGHFDFLRETGDPVTGVPVGTTQENLASAIEGETYEYTEMYPGFSKTARDEGFEVGDAEVVFRGWCTQCRRGRQTGPSAATEPSLVT